MISSRVLLRGTTVLLSRFPRRCLSTTTPDCTSLESLEQILFPRSAVFLSMINHVTHCLLCGGSGGWLGSL